MGTKITITIDDGEDTRSAVLSSGVGFDWHDPAKGESTVVNLYRTLTQKSAARQKSAAAQQVASVPAPAYQTVLSANTRDFIQRLVATIATDGATTLDKVATDQGISVETARAYIRNAGRTAKAHNIKLPIKAVWDACKGYNIYTMDA